MSWLSMELLRPAPSPSIFAYLSLLAPSAAAKPAAAFVALLRLMPPSKHPHSLVPPTHGVNLTRSFREPARAAR